MECNKDEAIRAKKLAEKKLTEKDIAGAKRFASKAQSLFPALEGLSQLQMILDVYVASQKKVNGEVDWYEIFGVDPLADDETIRKKYRKLALALHPDKNKSVGADGAFKIISEAWSLLSDKVKRDAYNEKRNIRASNLRARGGNPQAGAGKSIHKNFTSSSPRPRNPTTRDKSQQDIRTSHQKARGGNPPVGTGKSNYNNFTSSSSTINPATQDRTQQDLRPSYQKDRGGNPPMGAGKSGYDNCTRSSSSTINPATPDNHQQDTRASYQKARDGNPPAAAGKCGKNTFSSSTSGTRNSATPEHPQNVSAPYRANRNTFWTSCKTCMMQYEYVNIYRNQKLLCPNCRKPFLATEMPPPHTMGHKSSTKRPFKRKQQVAKNDFINTSSDSGRKRMGTSDYSGFNSTSRADVPKESSCKYTGARSESTSVVAAGLPAQSFQSTGKNSKTGHEEGISGAVNEEALQKKSNASRKADSDSGSKFEQGERATKKRCINEDKSYVGGNGVTNQMALGGGGNGQGDMSGSQMGGLGGQEVIISENNKPTIFRVLSQSETRHMLIEKAKMEILKVSKLGMVAAMKSSRKENKDVEKEMPDTINATEESVASGMKKEENMNVPFEDASNFGQPKNSLLSSATTNPEAGATEILSMTVPVLDEHKKFSLSAPMVDPDRKTTEIMTMIVPDSDFINFDKDRTEESFAKDQVWAAYDDKDGMPRFYALVREVTSRHPFKVKISWLNSRSNTELGTVNWVGCGFSKTCGDFTISRREVDEALNSFSHRVKWTKCARGVFQIFPRKGDVWALYRNWTSDWNELTTDDVIRKYDMVEVLEDYNEEHGVPVVPLVKVAGFKSVFHQHLDPRKIYTIPREEMFQFSHQVPSHLLTGQGSEKAPKGCLELDPAAVPEDLLQIIIEPEEEEVESMSKVGENGRRAEFGKDEGAAKELHGLGDANITRNGDAWHVTTEQ